MLVLFSTALGANVSPPFLRSSVREVFQSAAASVLSMLSPVVPQADGPGASSERSVVDPADSVQATPETPESVHTELVELLRADGSPLQTYLVAYLSLCGVDGSSQLISAIGSVW